MAIDLNDEIVQDFLVEAGEILETLNEQLVDLESRPDDVDLLNAVFRGFHTIKGGAGFLSIEALVNVCHTAENVFDILRNGQRKVDTELMDVVLQVLDVVNEMFQQINQGQEPEAADQSLLSRLNVFSRPDDGTGTTAAEEPVAEAPEPVAEPAQESPVEEVQATTDNAEATTPDSSASIDEITDDEFDDLLDQLHGVGKHSGVPPSEAATQAEEPQETVAQEAPAEAPAAPAPAATDEITEEEFEALLDELEGKKPAAPAAAEKAEVIEMPKEMPKDIPRAEAPKPAADAAPAKAGNASAPAAETTVRVETSVLDRIMNMVGELVLVRNRLSNLEERFDDEEITETVTNLDVVTSDLQSSVMKTRMQPIKKVFGRFPRVVRDLARSLKKDINLEMLGEDTDLDKNLVEALADPLVHLVRNSVDHGIEMPDVREAAGKPRQGTVALSAEQEGDHILLKIEDDGKGMDAEMLRRKAVEKGIMDEDAAARLDEDDCYNLIFMPGFSTKEEISDVSGRGVGMDVVKTRINQLNGQINIHSKLGAGTTMEIKVPLTLAIMPTLMVKLGNKEQIFALPLVNVNEIIELDMSNINNVDGQHVIVVRGKPVPLYYLCNWLTESRYNNEKEAGHVVVVSVGTSHIALYVDKLVGREEVVIKPLGAMLSGTKGLAGATITGNGKIALILDLPDLLQAHASRF